MSKDRKRFQVCYDILGMTNTYCVEDMDWGTALSKLISFGERYIDPCSGRGKVYPNGKGCYLVCNARIEEV